MQNELSIFELEEEEGQETESDLNINISEFTQAVIWGTDWTTETIVNQLKKGNINLKPRFQRRDAWGKKNKSKFIESLIIGLPIPQIILAENKNKKGTYIVIDGKQRLLSIRQFFADKAGDDFEQLKLSGLEIINELQGVTIDSLRKNQDYSEYLSALENQPIRTIVIRNWVNDSFLYTVFLRLNTGSVRLSPQELRQALNPGEFIDFVEDFSTSSKSIRKVLKLKKPDPRMRDVELVVRYFAFKYFIERYNGNLKAFLDLTVEELNEKWIYEEQLIENNAEQLNEAIEATINIFGAEFAFSKWIYGKYQKTFNRAIYDIMTYYFSIAGVREQAIENKEAVENKFRELCENDYEFLRSFETSTKNLEPTFKRFDTWGKALSKILNIKILIPRRL